jgi:predicted nucleotidyltransferase
MTMTPPVRGRAGTLERVARSRALLRAYGVTGIAVFGSASRDEMAPESDVDLLVDFDDSTSHSPSST